MTKPREEIKSVPNTPAKRFFVSMLTRDIELHDAILDLLDNCVDGAIRSRSKEQAGDDSLEGFWAYIKFDDKRFTIQDNCGGIPWNIAKDYAFCMGRPEGVESEAGTIGVVGIGMKRAIFKMGRECYVHSNHQDDAFLVTIPKSWFDNDDDWGTFEAERENPAKKSEHGTIVEISALEDGAKVAFAKGSSFRETFPTIVAESYSYLIEKGFKVYINEVEVKRRPIRICFESPEDPKKKGHLIRPYVYESTFDNVDVFVVIGYRSRLPTQEEMDDDAKASYAAKEAGWTIVCNDRVVLSNDRTLKTGWGFGGVPNFHSQFSSIAGIVEFRSPYTASLPVTTTKRGIDTSKDIYTIVRQRMQEGLKYFIRNTNRWKGFESEIKRRFDELKPLDLKELKKAVAKLSFSAVRGEGQQKQFKPDLPEKTQNETTRRISFTKEMVEIEKVSLHLFDEIRPPNIVGETCFDRIYKAAK